MKIKTTLILVLIILICATLLSGCIATNEDTIQPRERTIEEIAVVLMNHFTNGTFTEAYNTLFDDIVKGQTTPEQLQLIWTQITNNYGDFIQITATRTTKELGYDIVYVTCVYEELGLLDTRIVFNETKFIAGFQFIPTDISDQYQPPDYANTSSFTESNVTIGENTEWELPGTLTLPNSNGPFPAVVLVHGSGPNDRDETIGPNKPFKDIAWGLATQGIAVLRYEKRTKYYTTTMVNMLQNITVKEEVIDDALAAIRLLKDTEHINESKIYLLGHSLGGMLAPRIANRTSDLEGIILMAAPARHLEDLILNQTIYLSGLDNTITLDEKEQIDSIQENVTKIKTLNITNDEIVLSASLTYWEDLAKYEPISTARNLNLSMLILQGKRDYQVIYEDDYAAWQTTFSLNTNVTFSAYDNLNHLFLPGSGDPNYMEYNDPGNIPEEVITDIANWIIK